MLGKKTKVSKKDECPEKNAGVLRAEKISEQYKQLSECCNVLSEIAKKEDSTFGMMSMYSGGWRLNESAITSAGIDIEDVYSYIGKLAKKRRLELELALEKLDT